MTQRFGDYELALKTKEVIARMVRGEIDALRPPPKYGEVATLDPLTVVLNGDVAAIPVSFGSIFPSAVGQVVRVEGPPGDRYITDVVGATSGSDPYDASEFDSITVGGVVIDTTVLDAPTGLSAAQGLEFENIYAIVEWDAVAGAAQYQVEFAIKLGLGTYDLVRLSTVSTLSDRFDALIPYTDYGYRVRAVNPIGILGNVSAWTDFTTTGDSTVPPQVDPPVLSRGATTLVVSFDPLGELVAPDVARGHGLYEIQVDTANTFDTGNLRSNLTSASIVSFSDIFVEATWYARVRAIDTSGNVGAWSTTSSTTAGAVADDMIVASGLDAAHIQFGTMSGDRITTNTLDANAIKASTLSAKYITLGAGGGLKIGNPTTNGVYIDDAGITAYKASAQTFKIASDGTATFSGTVSAATITGGTINGTTITGTTITGGTIRTASSGERIQMDSTNTNRIKFFTSAVSEYAYGYIHLAYDDFFKQSTVEIRPPRALSSVGDTVFRMTNEASGGGTMYLYGEDRIDLFCDSGGSINIGDPLETQHLHVDTTTMYWHDFHLTASTYADVMINRTTWQVTSKTSSKRFKKDFAPIDQEFDSSLIFHIDFLGYTPCRPETKEDDGNRTFGVLAEDVHAMLVKRGVNPDLWMPYDADGNPAGFIYEKLAIPTIIELSKTNTKVDEIERRLAVLEGAS